MTAAVITTSWDDGHPSDLKLAELLDRCGVEATFYIPIQNPERPVMPDAEMRGLSERFEIAAHTVNHVRLAGLTGTEVRNEISGGKTALENKLGRSVTMFCYPGGKFDQQARQLVAEAGFSGARTTMAFRWDWNVDPFLLPTTGQAYPHSAVTHLRHALAEGNFAGVRNAFTRVGFYRNWVKLALRQLEAALEDGGCWHLWGHAWEIEQIGAWDEVETVLREAGRSGARHEPNGKLPGIVAERRGR